MLLEVVLILSLGLSCWRDHLLIMAKGKDQIHSLLLSSRQPLSAVDLDYLKIAGEVCLGPSSSFSMPACSSCYSILTKHRLRLSSDFVNGGHLLFLFRNRALFREDLARTYAAEIFFLQFLIFMQMEKCMGNTIPNETVKRKIQS